MRKSFYGQFEQHNPFRSPSWRADRTLSLVSARPVARPSRGRDDEYVKAYYRLIRSLTTRCSSREDELELYFKQPDLFLANIIHQHEDTEVRALLQAKLLGRENNAGIADWLGTLPEAIEWYERLFFNVRDRLDNRGYILKIILGNPEDRSGDRFGQPQRTQREMLYKLFSYIGGPMVLDVMLTGIGELPVPTSIEQCGEWFDEAIRMGVRRRGAEIAQVIQASRLNAVPMLEMALHLNDNREAGGGAGGFDYIKHIAAVIEDVPWSLANRTIDVQPVLQQEFEALAVEPRENELVALAAGTVPAGLEAFRNVKFRDPSGKGA